MKVLFDVLLMRIVPSIVFSLIVYFMIGLQLSVHQFCIFLATIFMTSVFGSATCFFISAVIPVFGKRCFSIQNFVFNLFFSCCSDYCGAYLCNYDDI
jgi:ATP-binding cassette subfamily G (WHITE) protein 2